MNNSRTASGSQARFERFQEGTVLPAHLLALTPELRLDRRRMRALTRYYLDAGAGGLAVGVHTTQFAIRTHGLYEPVLAQVAETAAESNAGNAFMVAGVTGRTSQAAGEARVAASLGYDAALLNVAAFKGAAEDEIIDHCREIAQIMPLIGFYLLTEVGGIILSRDFWRKFCEIDNVIGIKMAPFNRYRTLDVVHGLVQARAEKRIALYTGNDDHIVLDLLQPFVVPRGDERVTVHVRGGLLGHWAVWTRSAVQLFDRLREARTAQAISTDLLALDSIVTDCNRAIYDAQNDFRGCVPGCHEVLRRQGLFDFTGCLDPKEVMSPGQLELIDRAYSDYPEMNDDAFVRANLDRWLA